MNTYHWVSPHFHVKIILTATLGLLPSTEGLLDRAFGVSEKAVALFGKYDKDIFIRVFKDKALIFEPQIVEVMEHFLQQNPQVRPDFQKYRERFFPGAEVEMDIKDVNEGEGVARLSITYNAVPNASGGLDVFIAFLHSDEVETYRLERFKMHNQTLM